VAALEAAGVAPSREAADSLVALLDHEEVRIRAGAVQNLGRLAASIDRRGVVEVPRGPQFPPLVSGIIQYLVQASADEDPGVRTRALFALADTRRPVARDALAAHLRDPAPHVRLTAACLLTEFHDDAGMKELGLALERLTAPTGTPDPRRDTEAEHLLAALTRITGTSLGPIPPQPGVSSVSRKPGAPGPYDELLAKWKTWLREHPQNRD
jgi:HEAT repeat protein